MKINETRMFTTKEVARIFGVSEETVRRWLRTQKIEAIRPGGTRCPWYIPESSLQKLINPQTKKRIKDDR